MMRGEDPKETPNQKFAVSGITQNGDSFISPRFMSVAAMAGWDEESIISLVVEDTPDRDVKLKRRTRDLHFKTPPPSNSRRKRKPSTRSPVVPILNLEDDQEDPKTEGSERQKNEDKMVESDKTEEQHKDKNESQVVKEETTKGECKVKSEDSAISCSNPAVPCLDKLREELSCAICLEICFEPSTTSCGHSFCKKCLRSAADKCGKKCPKCRQLISNGRSCMVNTVLWNTIQLLFPQEVEARKAAGASNAREADDQRSESSSRTNVQTRIRPSGAALDPRMRENVAWLSRTFRRRRTPSQDEDAALVQSLRREDVPMASRGGGSAERRRRRRPNQEEDAALALRLQREEFLEAFRGSEERRRHLRDINNGMRNRQQQPL